MTSTVVIIFAMLALSFLAGIRLPKDARLPMQWDWRGRPTWTASTWFAVLFTPALATAVAAFVFAVAQEKAPGLAGGIMLLFLVVHVVHLFFAARHVSRHG
jgi:hypothetical protein